MRLVGQIHITLPGESVRRAPNFWDNIKKRFGGKIDLETDRVRVAVEATALVDQVRGALVRLGFDNAVSLVIDDTVIFQDTDGKAGDLPDMMLALSDHASVFSGGFKELRMAVEGEEAGLHLLVETRAVTEHPKGSPSAYVSLGGRVKDLEPRRGESGEAYRARVEPLVADRGKLESARALFESFVARLESALRAAMPEAVVEQKRAEAVIVRPSGPADKERPVQSPASPGYDPYQTYYPSPMGMMLDMMMISAVMHMMMPPMFTVMSPSGAYLGSSSDPHALSGASGGADDGDPGADNGADDGDGDMGDDGGGDDGGGGDFGGDDF